MMDYTQLNISHEQAQEIALAIIADIKSYVEAHPSEYEDFLKSESESEVKANVKQQRSTYRKAAG